MAASCPTKVAFERIARDTLHRREGRIRFLPWSGDLHRAPTPEALPLLTCPRFLPCHHGYRFAGTKGEGLCAVSSNIHVTIVIQSTMANARPSEGESNQSVTQHGQNVHCPCSRTTCVHGHPVMPAFHQFGCGFPGCQISVSGLR